MEGLTIGVDELAVRRLAELRGVDPLAASATHFMELKEDVDRHEPSHGCSVDVVSDDLIEARGRPAQEILLFLAETNTRPNHMPQAVSDIEVALRQLAAILFRG